MWTNCIWYWIENQARRFDNGDRLSNQTNQHQITTLHRYPRRCFKSFSSNQKKRCSNYSFRRGKNVVREKMLTCLNLGQNLTPISVAVLEFATMNYDKNIYITPIIVIHLIFTAWSYSPLRNQQLSYLFHFYIWKCF